MIIHSVIHRHHHLVPLVAGTAAIAGLIAAAAMLAMAAKAGAVLSEGVADLLAALL
ncbi:hypothetical protein [Chelatococcus reniformis]|uniref:Uncharacterized protein n=1 Tax=Chelatococcus reniformis TaxID=1494448 RepID=A0A916UXL8_9HYPH|nr:hypothetical protein [Chelatococcus reniformis]GGC93418.1 hypothetical protein GCM10010994_59010 [Chelatococcus reniformis]